MSSTSSKALFCTDAPPPGGHYSQGMVHGRTLYVSGQLGLTPTVPDPELVSLRDQVVFALGNIESIASLAGAGRTDIVKCTVYVTSISSWDEVNAAYAEFFGAHRPARSIVPCPSLHFGSKVEIEAIVALPESYDMP